VRHVGAEILRNVTHETPMKLVPTALAALAMIACAAARDNGQRNPQRISAPGSSR
jgi:hypothetical protein